MTLRSVCEYCDDAGRRLPLTSPGFQLPVRDLSIHEVRRVMIDMGAQAPPHHCDEVESEGDFWCACACHGHELRGAHRFLWPKALARMQGRARRALRAKARGNSNGGSR